LSRLKGVKSVIRTAKVDAPLRMESPAPADGESKDGLGGKNEGDGKGEPSVLP
jgi:hypothetical protein